MSNVSVRMTPQVEKYLAGTKNRSAAANRAIEAWIACEREARRQLKGLLTVAELSAFIDVANGCVIDTANADSLLYRFEDACHFEGLAKKWGVDADAVIEKTADMSMAKWIVLSQWAVAYWDGCQQGDIAEYAAHPCGAYRRGPCRRGHEPGAAMKITEKGMEEVEKHKKARL